VNGTILGIDFCDGGEIQRQCALVEIPRKLYFSFGMEGSKPSILDLERRPMASIVELEHPGIDADVSSRKPRLDDPAGHGVADDHEPCPEVRKDAVENPLEALGCAPEGELGDPAILERAFRVKRDTF
jgi:hypothetical protein